MKRTWIILTVMAAGTALSLLAQDAPQPPTGPGPGPRGPGFGPGRMGPPPFIAVLDVDKDGTLSAAEIADAPKQLLTLDKNGDGKLTLDELRPTPPEGAPQPPEGIPAPGQGQGFGKGKGKGPGMGMGMGEGRGPRGPRGPMGPPLVIAQIDTDKDGVLSADEIKNASAALLKLDANKDGQLTPEELHPGFGGPRGPRGPGGPDGQPEGAPAAGQ